MPISMEEFESLVSSKAPGTPLPEILGVKAVYWSGSLAGYIYLVPDVIGETAAIVPAALKQRFAT